jgi:hypothetical protein
MQLRDHVLGFSLLLLAIVSSAVAGRYVYAHRQPELALDADHCPPTPPGAWLVAFDITNRQPPQEQQRITSDVIAIAERMHINERLALHVLTGNAEDSAAPWPLPGFANGFRLCKPADPTTVDPRVQNERLVRAAYEQDFLKPLQGALPDLVKGTNATRSPLLQAIEIMMWSPLFRRDVPNRTLVIFSDLLIHTRELSQLSRPLTNPCSVLASDIGKRLKARNWQGVRVILQYLRNPADAQRQSPEHLRFWSQLFYGLGAAEVFDGLTLTYVSLSDPLGCPSTATSPTRNHAKAHRNR